MGNFWLPPNIFFIPTISPTHSTPSQFSGSPLLLPRQKQGLSSNSSSPIPPSSWSAPGLITLQCDCMEERQGSSHTWSFPFSSLGSPSLTGSWLAAVGCSAPSEMFNPPSRSLSSAWGLRSPKANSVAERRISPQGMLLLFRVS